MKLLALGSLLFTGGTAVAMQDETINQNVTQAMNQVKAMFQKGFQGSMIDTVKETGYPYPNDTFLAQLTDEQEAIYLATIDQINATYDWANMTDEEIAVALQEVKAELTALRAELGIEAVQTQTRGGKHWNSDFVPGSGNDAAGSYDGDCPLDDVVPDETVDAA